MKTKQVMAMVCGTMVWAGAALAQPFDTNFTFDVNAGVPDGNVTGLTLATNLGGMAGNISSVTVSLDLSGGFNGDYYAYLRGPNGELAVLLNRVGVSNSASQFGYGDGGMDVEFLDAAADSIQYYQNYTNPAGGTLFGAWQPEGVTVDPLTNDPTAFFGAPQSATLALFDQSDPNGEWTLFLADVAGGNQGTVVSWGLNITTVPEPGTLALAGFGVVVIAWRRRRKSK